jgi:hypothetical protein
MNKTTFRLPPDARQQVKTTFRRLIQNQGKYFSANRCLVLFLVLGSLSAPQASVSRVNSGVPADANENQGKFPTLTRSSFGMQCGTGKPTNCPNATWPTSVAQPGMIRLWDSQVQWHALNPARGTYNWQTLDKYLDVVAAHQPRDVMYTFGYTPCWVAKAPCATKWPGSGYPPNDLTANGSPSFNAFVEALVDHCSPAGHCVKDSIKYWEMWNEPNAQHFYTGTVPQLYSLMAPAIAIVRKKVSGVTVLTPPVMRADSDWMQDWMKEEDSHGRLSDIFSFHLYLLDKTPEERFGMVKKIVDMKNHAPGWSSMPWMDGETNFDPVIYLCNSKYAPEDCVGQVVRWQLLHFGYGAMQLSWFYFNTTIGRNPEYATAYKTMMDWVVGGHFTAECSAKGDVYSCPFIQANGHHAMFVWSVNGKGKYVPSSEYVDYKDLDGNTAKVSSGQPAPIGVKPIMLEAAN